MNLTHIIKKPIITEKSLNDAQSGIFTFLVDPKSTKNQIAQAVRNIYSVDVVSIRTINRPGKPYRVGRTRLIKTKANNKKAFIKLQKGQKIDLFDIEESKQ